MGAGPGDTRAHHLTWGLAGQLRGEEECCEYSITDSGLVARGSHRVRAGEIDRVSPALGDIHTVANASDRVSVSIHVCGANIGTVSRHAFDTETGASSVFVSGYCNIRPLDNEGV